MTLHHGDCRDVMAAMEAASIDAVVTDPPYELAFMGRTWDASGIANDPVVWRECLRVLKPGGYLVAFGGTRTYHRLACAIEDAGFTIRDSLHWVYGSGFPKGKACLKPAHEPVVLAWKPAKRMVPLNVDACRVGTGDDRISGGRQGSMPQPMSWGQLTGRERPTGGRWPPNILLTHSPECNGECQPGCPVAEMDAQSGTIKSPRPYMYKGKPETERAAYGKGVGYVLSHDGEYGDTGGASRFFPVFRYQAKASSKERPRLPDGTTWPTVKPVALMRWLVRLVTPPGGTVLDPFAGTGTTGEACALEGFGCVLIDSHPDAVALARQRLAKPIQPAMEA